jgi:hypothetical protein
MNFPDEPSTTSSTNVPSSNILDPLHELFTTTTSQNKTETNTEIQNIDKDLENAFTSSNDTSINNSGIMSNEKIMALFNTSTGINIRPASMQSPNRM